MRQMQPFCIGGFLWGMMGNGFRVCNGRWTSLNHFLSRVLLATLGATVNQVSSSSHLEPNDVLQMFLHDRSCCDGRTTDDDTLDGRCEQAQGVDCGWTKQS